jgi:hypothetical protein
MGTRCGSTIRLQKANSRIWIGNSDNASQKEVENSTMDAESA